MSLRAENLTKSYRRRMVVKGVNLSVDSGEIVGLLGPNGAGKTTSFNMISGLLPPDSGQVWLEGRDLARLPLYKRARLGLGYLPQESTVFRGMTVFDNFFSLFQARGIDGQEATERTETLITRYNLSQVRDNLGSQLSGGERRRVEMARTRIADPTVVLLDEPFAGVDPIAVGEIQRFIRDMVDDGIGVLLTDHNVRETLRLCDRAYIINEGDILVAGTPEEIVAHKRAREIYLGEGFTL